MSDDAAKTRASRPTRDPTWSVRNMPLGEREQAIDASKRADMDIGEWLALAVRTRLAVERGEGMGLADSDRLPDLARLVEIAAQTAAATGKPLPRSIARLVYRELRVRLWDKLSAVGQIVGPPPETATPAGNWPDRRTEGECDATTSQTPAADYRALVREDQGYGS